MVYALAVLRQDRSTSDKNFVVALEHKGPQQFSYQERPGIKATIMTSTKKQDDSHPETNEQTISFNPQCCELIYVTDQQPGIARQRLKEGFRYIDSAGKIITDKDTLARINALKIPPAYEKVWICS